MILILKQRVLETSRTIHEAMVLKSVLTKPKIRLKNWNQFPDHTQSQRILLHFKLHHKNAAFPNWHSQIYLCPAGGNSRHKWKTGCPVGCLEKRH